MRIRQCQHCFWIISLFAFAIPLCAHADSVSVARKAIQAIYDKQSAAEARLDPIGAFTGYAPDYASKDLSGKVSTLADEQQSARNLMVHTRRMTVKTTIPDRQ